MDYVIFLGLLNLILLGRLRLIGKDQSISWRDALVMGIIPMAALLFLQFNISWVLLATYLLTAPAVLKWAEERTGAYNRSRGISMVVHLLLLGFFCSRLFNLSTNNLWDMFLRFINEILIAGRSMDRSILMRM